MPLLLKIVLVVTIVSAIGLFIAGFIVSVTFPHDSGRGDIVHSEVALCLNSIATEFLISDVLFIVAYMVNRSIYYGWFFAIIKWFCIIVGVFGSVGGLIWSIVMANLSIKEYDDSYGNNIAIVSVYEGQNDNSSNYFDIESDLCRVIYNA